MALIWDANKYGQAYIWTNPITKVREPCYNHMWASYNNFKMYADALQNMVSHANFTPSSEVLFVGCGFGYWIEVLLMQPGVQANNVWGIDTSPYITANKNDTVYTNSIVAPKILDLDITSSTILNDLKPYYGGNGKVGGWIISTLVLTSLQTDQEITNFGSACENISGPQAKVAHIFSSLIPNSDLTLGMNWQSRDYWSSRLPNHWLIDQHGWNHPEVLAGTVEYGVDYFGIWNPDVGAWQ